MDWRRRGFLLAVIRALCDVLRHHVSLQRPRGALGAPPIAPFLGIGGWNGRLENLAPIERHVGILRFELAPDGFVERLAPDFDAWWGAKPEQHAGRRFAAAVRRLHQVKVLVASLVAGEPEKGHQDER